MRAGPTEQQTRLKMVELPPFPAVAIRALQLVSKSDTRLSDLHSLICSDPSFAAEILRLANSPLYGIRVEIKNTLQATMLLGFERVKGLAFTIGMRAFLGDAMQYLSLQTCWHHSLACAMIAEEIVGPAPIDKGVAYTAGLIHDLGRLALAALQPAQYDKLFVAEGDLRDYRQREVEMFGMDHCQAGGFLVHAWNLPEPFADIASRHHDLQNSDAFDLLSAVRISCRMADILGFGFAAPAEPAYCQLLRELPDSVQALIPDDAAEFAEKISDKVSAIKNVQCEGAVFLHPELVPNPSRQPFATDSGSAR